MLIYTHNGTGTASSGTFSSVVSVHHCILKQLQIIPTTASTTYDFYITDVYDNDVYHQYDVTGEFNQVDINLPGRRNWTLVVENASADEAFEFTFKFLNKS